MFLFLWIVFHAPPPLFWYPACSWLLFFAFLPALPLMLPIAITIFLLLLTHLLTAVHGLSLTFLPFCCLLLFDECVPFPLPPLSLLLWKLAWLRLNDFSTSLIAAATFADDFYKQLPPTLLFLMLFSLQLMIVVCCSHNSCGWCLSCWLLLLHPLPWCILILSYPAVGFQCNLSYCQFHHFWKWFPPLSLPLLIIDCSVVSCPFAAVVDVMLLLAKALKEPILSIPKPKQSHSKAGLYQTKLSKGASMTSEREAMLKKKLEWKLEQIQEDISRRQPQAVQGSQSWKGLWWILWIFHFVHQSLVVACGG